MNREIVAFTKKLISINTEPQNKKELNIALNLIKKTLKGIRVKTFSKKGYSSLLFYNKPTKKFRIILNGHVDVIPGKGKQLVPYIKKNRLYGLGAMDMKGNLATLIHVFRDVAFKVNYPIALQIVTDEEIGGFYGTKYQIERGIRADFVISSEPTNFDIVYTAKGILWCKIRLYGKSAHSAYPWRGINAVDIANKFITTLEKKIKNPKKDIWKSTLNIANIQVTNKAFNKIPDYCELWIDIRYVPKDKDLILQNIKNILPPRSKFEVIINEPPLNTPRKNSYIQRLKKITENLYKRKIRLRGANGTSDVRHYTTVGVPGIEFGSIGDGIGGDEEWVDLRSLEIYYNILIDFLSEYS